MKIENDENKKVGWLEKNLITIICTMIGIGVGIAIMLLMWPERIAKLKDGTEKVASVDKLTISADDLYSNMKKSTGLASILEMIDKELLNQEYDLADEASDYAKTTSQTYYENYKNYYGYSKDEFLASNGFKTEEQFLEYLSFDYLRNTWYADYLKTLIDEKDMKKFYKNEAFGDKKVYILSSTESKDDLKNVKKDLKGTVDIKAITEKYEKNIVVNDFDLTIEDIASFSEKIIKQIKKLNAGESSEIIEDESYGNLIIYVESSKELGKYEDIKESIIKSLSNRLDAKDKNLYYKAFIKLREKYNIDFSDTSLKSEYKEYKKQYK